MQADRIKLQHRGAQSWNVASRKETQTGRKQAGSSHAEIKQAGIVSLLRPALNRSNKS
jgi:hypothetical protein